MTNMMIRFASKNSLNEFIVLHDSKIDYNAQTINDALHNYREIDYEAKYAFVYIYSKKNPGGKLIASYYRPDTLSLWKTREH